MCDSLPLLILAGSDPQPGRVGPGLSRQDMLDTYKGALPVGNGRCLAAEVAHRFSHTNRFSEVVLFGPQHVYEPLVDLEICDVTGPLTGTLVEMLNLIDRRFPADRPVAITTCDILPTVDELNRFFQEAFEAHPDAHLWWQVVRATPEQMGAGSWKPSYTLRLREDEGPANLYPGHVIIARPEALRLELLIGFLGLAYRYRNWPLKDRVGPMLRRGIGLLLQQDCRNVRRGRWPILTLSVPWHLLRAYFGTRFGRLTISGFERHLAQTVIHRRFRRGPRPMVITVTPDVSFAKDIDTWGELREAVTAQNAATEST